ncbi:MAG: hypothetical protein QOG04_1184 [Actinomycetota bacterium]|nr:hypothetical protein [Actinomycetota bacterium]
MGDLKVSVAELLGRPGEYRDVRVASELEGVTTALARLDPPEVRGDLRAESVVEGILVTGRVEAETALECSRCLEKFSGQLDVRVCEMFVAPGHVQPDEDAYLVSGTELDLEPMLRDAVTLALPLNPLCEEACEGLCPTCGKRRDLGPCGCQEDETDPRWAALSALKEQLED